MAHKSIYELFEEVATANAGKTAYQFKKHGQWCDLSWQDARRTVRRIGRALMALGVNKGDRVNILSGTRLEWVLADFGTVCCGGVTVGIYPTNLAEDCGYIINHSGAEVIILENAEQLEKIRSIRADIPRIRHIVILDGPGDPASNVLAWDEFLALADKVGEEQFGERAGSIGADDLASLVYTSGTTGVPKGAMISNGNLLFTSGSVMNSLHTEPHFITLLFLPLAHVFARLIVYTCLRGALTIAFAEDITKVGDNLKEIRPHFIASVPRIFEKVHGKITEGVREAGGVKETLFNWAIGVGLEVSKLKQAGKPVPALLGMKYALANKLVFAKIQAALGGRLAWAVSGAAPLNKTIAEFFHACGVLILEGLGMTENTSFTNCNRFDRNKFGTVGPVGPGVEMKLADDGEIMFRGPNVMVGYYDNPESTAETITPDGWLLTGDIGVVDEDGFLKITDRKKDLIITAGGKNVAPQRIERFLRMSPLISQAVAIGDRRKFISALVTLDPETIPKWCQENGVTYSDLSELANDPKVITAVEAEVAKANKSLASFESVKKVKILPVDFSIEGGELTPTLKVKRKVVADKYATEIEQLYAE